MKTASVATKAILAAGLYYKVELYDIAIPGGSTYRFTSAQVPVKIGANTYGTGLTINRGPISQKAGLEVQSFDLRLTPQWDSPDAPILISGVPLLQAVKLGILDDAHVTMYKGFFNMPSGVALLDTSPGAVTWASGRVNTANADRMSAYISINDDIEILNVAMPRNVVQPGCLHQVYDAGCTLSAATFTQTGTLSGTPTQLTFNTNLTRANGYFDLGVITFTSGPNNGLKYVVKSYLNASGAITLIRPAFLVPASGNTFSIVPACKKTQDACANTNVANGPAFNNAAHFRGAPYVPEPETLYAGNTQTTQVGTPGRQGGTGSGTSFSGNLP